MRTPTSCVLLALLVSMFCAPRTAPAPRLEAPWILRVSEEREDFMARQRCRPTKEFGVVVYSQLTVGEDGSVTFREALACQGPLVDTPLGKWPSKENPNQEYATELSPASLANLKTFLEGSAVKEIQDFLNQAPIFDNFAIAIKRGQQEQHVAVYAFMPEHFELKQKPALTQLICRAKQIAAQATHSTTLPDYCAPALKGTN